MKKLWIGLEKREYFVQVFVEEGSSDDRAHVETWGIA